MTKHERPQVASSDFKKTKQPVDLKKENKKRSSKVGRWLGLVIKYLTLFLLIYTVINWWRKPVAPVNPSLQFVDYQGQTVDIEKMSYQSPVLVYFWGSWCGVCSITSPIINALSESKDYPIVTIAIQSGDNRELKNYLNSHNYSFTAINDSNGDIFNSWQGQVTPSYVIVNEGEVTQGLTGIQPKFSLKLRLWLSSL